MDQLLSPALMLALILTLLGCATLGVAYTRARRSAQAAASALQAPLARNAPSVREAAMLEALCQDLRTRTNGIVGLAELLLAAPLPEEQLHQADLIADSGRSLLRLLGDVLDVTRIDSGGLQLQAEPSDLRELLGHSVTLMQASARSRGLALVLLVDDAVPAQVVIDRARLRQVVLNLLGNAVKFTREGRIDVQARVAQTTTGPQLAISVIDSSEGIAHDRQGEIFQPFFRQKAPIGRTFREKTGTGLGLALSSLIVRAMGGDIALESAPGLGSCFSIRLPLVTPSFGRQVTGTANQAPEAGANSLPVRELEAQYHRHRDAMLASLHAASLPGFPGDETNWDSLASQLHRLAGVAASFGDEQMCDLARRIHAELSGQATPRLCKEAVLRHWDELQALRST